MHESGLVASLVARAESAASAAGGPATRIGLRIGAMSGVSPAALRAHWGRLAGPGVAGARLDIEQGSDLGDEAALGVALVYVDVARSGRE